MAASPITKFAVAETRIRLKRQAAESRDAEKHPEDPEAIHDLRVSIRRVTQCFRIFHGLLDPRPVKKLRRRLRKLMDLCAAVRNCDIALDLLRQAGIAEGASVYKLKKIRGGAEEKLHRFLKKERRRKRIALRASKHPAGGDWKLEDNLETRLRGILPALAEDYFAQGAAAAAPGANVRTLHQFRLSAKRFRYTLELFEQFYGSQLATAMKALKEVQDRLGAINDCVTTIDLLGPDPRPVPAIQKLLAHGRAEFESYWHNQIPPRKLAWWKRWLSHPSRQTTGKT